MFLIKKKNFRCKRKRGYREKLRKKNRLCYNNIVYNNQKQIKAI